MAWERSVAVDGLDLAAVHRPVPGLAALEPDLHRTIAVGLEHEADVAVVELHPRVDEHVVLRPPVLALPRTHLHALGRRIAAEHTADIDVAVDDVLVPRRRT